MSTKMAKIFMLLLIASCTVISLGWAFRASIIDFIVEHGRTEIFGGCACMIAFSLLFMKHEQEKKIRFLRITPPEKSYDDTIAP